MDKLSSINNEAQSVYDTLAEELKKDMENSNEDMDIILADMRDFLVKNDAELEEGMTFDIIIE
jgi:hypothetical protein